MADLSKIKLNGTEYDLKDNGARELITNKQDKAIYIQYTTSDDGETFTCNKTYNEILALANSSNSLIFGQIIFADGNNISDAIRLGGARIHADVIEWSFPIIDESQNSVTMVEISHKDDNSIVMNIINNSMPNVIYTVTNETVNELWTQGHSTHITCNYNFSDIAQLMASQIKFYPILRDENGFITQLTINYFNNVGEMRLDAITATTGTDISVISIDHNNSSLSIRKYNAPALKRAINLPEQFEDNEELWMVEEPILYFGSEVMPFNFIKCSSLPENNITPITTDNEFFTVYYISSNNIQGYMPSEIASQYGLEAGWYTLQQLLALYSQIIDSNAEYIGVVSDYSELMAESTGEPHNNYGLVIYHNFYIHENSNKYLYLGGPAIQPGEGKNSIIINGNRDTATGVYSLVNGAKNDATGRYSHAEGYMTTASGYASHSEGSEGGAYGDYSHVEGGASGHNAAYGDGSHAEGVVGNMAYGNGSHAEGWNSVTYGTGSHAEGQMTTANGITSHSEGYHTEANGLDSHAEGIGTIANCFGQHTSGRYNIAETAPAAEDEWGTYAEIVGNGTDNENRSNARTLDWSGNEVLAGKLTVGANPTNNMDVVTKQYMENAGYLTSYTETDPTVPSWAKASSKPTYTASEVGALPSSTTYVSSFNGSAGAITYTAPVTSVNGQTGAVSLTIPDAQIQSDWNATSGVTAILNKPTIPTDISDLTDENRIIPTVPETVSSFQNDAGYLTSFTETDPTVPSWAKAVSKPTYTASEVGALPDSTTYVSSFNGSTGAINYTAPVVSVNGTTGTVVINKLQTSANENNVDYNLIGTASSNNNTSAVNVYQQSLISASKSTNFTRLTIGSSSIPGEVRIYSNVSNASGYTDLKSGASSTNERTITFPDASGTVALTTDIPSISSWALASSKPNYTFSELTSHPTSLEGYGITDAYTKTEVDGLVSGVLHYKGTKATVSALPSSGNVTGDVWHITADGSEWAWDGSAWQELGTAIDLTGYLQSSDIAAWAKAANKPSYTASEVGALPSNTNYVSSFNGQSGAITYVPPVSSVNGQTGIVELTIPSDTSDLTNGAGFLTSFTETDPTVPSWAKASTKPSYTASEVGAATSSHVHGNVKNDGTITVNTSMANGDRLLFSDTSDSSKIKSTSITIGTSTTQYLANNGTWQNLPTVSVSQKLTSGTEIGSVNNTKLYAPTPYDDSALAARVTALEQLEWATYYSGRSNPSNSQGQNGDIYLQY